MATMAFPVSSASAATNSACRADEPTVWKAFAPWKDLADYWLAPGGDFESGTAGWALSGAKVVQGNETLGIMRGRHSLALGNGLVSTGSTAVSPPFCVTADHPTFRYALKVNGAVGALTTFVRYQAADGTTQEDQVWSKTSTTLLPGRWKPSDLQPLATRMPMARLNGVAVVRLVFRSPVNLAGSGYQIDDVLVDPYRMR